LITKVLQGDCETILDTLKDLDFFEGIHLTFLDPPFNQAKDYNLHDDNMPEEEYWAWLKRILKKIYNLTVNGGAIYFMQREKNTEYVLRILRETGWQFQNLIIWNKLTSAIPSKIRFNKKYQIIAFHTKGKKPLTFNNLRYEPPQLAMHELERDAGIYLTDVWDDIRELTSGYFAGEEAIRIKNDQFFVPDGERFHKQQSPIELLTRIILSSSKVGDTVLDPFAGTGVTAVVAKQLKRNSISIEIDPLNVKLIKERIKLMRNADNIEKFYGNYIYTENLDKIWFGREVPSRIENYYHKGVPKNKLNDMYLMKETIKNILHNEFNIPEKNIKLDYRLKDKNGKIHRFELAVLNSNKSHLIFRIIYAKNLNQADFWFNRFFKENEIIKEIHPNYEYRAILSGIAFKNIINTNLNNDIKKFCIAFPGWKNIIKLPSLKQALKNFDFSKIIDTKKQITLDLF